MLDPAMEFAQSILRRGTLGLHLLRGLQECRRGDLDLPCEVDLALLEVADFLGEPLRLGSGGVEFGFRRFEIGGGCIVGAPRYTGSGSEGGETQRPDCCCVNPFASPHCVVLARSLRMLLLYDSDISLVKWSPFVEQKSPRLYEKGKWYGARGNGQGLSIGRWHSLFVWSSWLVRYILFIEPHNTTQGILDTARMGSGQFR